MHTTIDQMWGAAQELLRTMLNEETYNLWFAPLRAIRHEQGSVTLEVANEFCAVWINDNYKSLLQEVLTRVVRQPTQVQLQVGAHPPAPPPAEINNKPKITKLAADANAIPGERESLFNPKYTFDSFVVGDNNNFAHAAAVAVAQAPGKSYNPLFLYGGVGLGKTHLLQAIGQYILARTPNIRVTYVSTEKFTNEFIDAIQNSQLTRFRKRYRHTEVLLMDDIQFLAGKERIQEEFFHTFNALHEAHRQIVVTCDRPAGNIQNLEPRLFSRFEWGLVTDLQPPDVEIRTAILRKKASGMGVSLPEEIIQFIAQRIRSNIRRLEGALIRVTSYVALTGTKPTLPLAEELLREILHEEGRSPVTIDLIQKRVAARFDIRLVDMTSKRRPENIAFPRQVAMFLARQLTTSSLNTIGEAFGGRDHGTVMHACRLVKDRMDVDPGVREVVHYLEQQLQQP